MRRTHCKHGHDLSDAYWDAQRNRRKCRQCVSEWGKKAHAAKLARAGREPRVWPARIDRFWSKVDKTGGPDACWEWTGLRFEKGYGIFVVDGRNMKAPRWLLGHLRGRDLVWPDELALHSCDNPPCVNPAHLSVGTQKENIAQAIARGRAPHMTRRSA